MDVGGNGFAVVASEEKPYSVAKAAVVLARVKGLILYSASSFLRDHPGIFDRNAASGLAECLSRELGALGISTMLVEEKEMPEIPPALAISAGRFVDDAFLFTPPGRPVRESDSIRLDSVTLIACAWVGVTERAQVREQRRIHVGEGQHASVVPVVHTRSVDRQNWSQLLDLLSEDETYPRLRINADRFDYAALGERLFATLSANFMALSGLFTVRCPRACIDESIALLLDDDPRTVTKLPTLTAFDNYLLWKSVLGRPESGGG